MGNACESGTRFADADVLELQLALADELLANGTDDLGEVTPYGVTVDDLIGRLNTRNLLDEAWEELVPADPQYQ